jgi:hypothetical protein
MCQYTNHVKLTELLSALRVQGPYSSYPSQHEIEDTLNDLANAHNFRRLKPEFREAYDSALSRINNELGEAHKQWRFYRNAKAALIHLENVAGICNERLSPDYHAKYSEAVSYFRQCK